MSGEFVKAGYLIKSPPDFKAMVAHWHKRWFLLMDSKLVYPLAARYVRLEYYQSEQEAKRLADPKGVINLNTCTQVCSREPMKGHKHMFDVHTDERVYHLVADTGEDKHQWIDTLNTLLFSPQQSSSPGRIRRWSPTQASEAHSDAAIVRTREGSGKMQRPLSFTGCPSPKSVHSRSPRPLPPVPNGAPPQKPPRHRPLPPTPANRSTTPTGSQDESKKSVSPNIKRRKTPPPKPAPYKKSASTSTGALPTTPIDISAHYEVAPGQKPYRTSGSPTSSDSTAVDISSHYEVAPGQSPVIYPSPTARRKVPVTRSLDDGEDYSVLENANISALDPNNDMYSHLALSGTTSLSGRNSAVPLPEDPVHSKGVHSVILTNDDDYSLLHH